MLRADADIDPADRDIAVDRDTMDVPGSPSIMETIFGKIDRAAVLLSDLIYVAERVGGTTPQFGGGAWAGYEDRQNYD